jgi:hypothetical protein
VVFSVIVLLLDLGFLLTPTILLRPMHQVQRLKWIGASNLLMQVLTEFCAGRLLNVGADEAEQGP